MFFDNWSVLGRTVLVGALAYIALVFLLRISGKRTLSKWNAFDFVVTIAIGSTFATIILSKGVTLAQGVLALFLLVALQFVVTWLSVRSETMRSLIKADPVLLLYKGDFQHEAMRRARVTESEIRGALRENGIGSTSQAAAVVLETDGSFSVIQDLGSSGEASTLNDVKGYPPSG